MSNEPTPSHGVMEGKGAYNRHASLPAGGAALALPLLVNAVRHAELDTGDQPVVIAGPAPSGSTLGDRFDVQLVYEHSARAMASADSDVRYVDLPDEINMSDPTKAAYYAQHARVVLPGLGTPKSAQTVAVPSTRVAWGITVMKTAPNRDNAIKFLQLLLSRTGTAMLMDHGPTPISPALVSPADFRNLPESLRPLVRMTDSIR
jgi:hypothetical protein